MEPITDVEPTLNYAMLDNTDNSDSQIPQSHIETAILETATTQVPHNVEVYGLKQPDVSDSTSIAATTTIFTNHKRDWSDIF